jgi:hypothetical protein
MKIVPVVAGLFQCGRTDGRTDEQEDITKLIVTARKFANSPKTI